MICTSEHISGETHLIHALLALPAPVKLENPPIKHRRVLRNLLHPRRRDRRLELLRLHERRVRPLVQRKVFRHLLRLQALVNPACPALLVDASRNADPLRRLREQLDMLLVVPVVQVVIELRRDVYERPRAAHVVRIALARRHMHVDLLVNAAVKETDAGKDVLLAVAASSREERVRGLVHHIDVGDVVEREVGGLLGIDSDPARPVLEGGGRNTERDVIVVVPVVVLLLGDGRAGVRGGYLQASWAVCETLVSECECTATKNLHIDTHDCLWIVVRRRDGSRGLQIRYPFPHHDPVTAIADVVRGVAILCLFELVYPPARLRRTRMRARK